MGDEARETNGAMQRLMEQMRSLPGIADVDVLLPRAPEPGELSLLGGYSGIGRSMFGGIPIRQSSAVPEGTAYLVDRNALQFDPRASLQLDRAGSSYGFSRAPGEADEDFRARMHYTLTRPINGPTVLDEAAARVNPEPETRSWYERAFRWMRRGDARLNEPAPETRQRLDCYMCGTRGYEAERFHPTNGMCNTCHHASHRRDHPFGESAPYRPCHRCGSSDPTVAMRSDTRYRCEGCEHEHIVRVMDEVLDSVDKTSGPTAEELEATYRV